MTTAENPLVHVENLEVAYGSLSVLEDVSVDISRGEFVGLVGPNGAGKTTLLRALSGAITPSSGRVRIDGTRIDAVNSRASSRLVGVVPQNTSLSFSFDVRSVVEMGRYAHRSRFAPPSQADREHVDRALERTRTLQFADRQIDAVSGGERQRVLLARAIAQDTPLLLLDEPTASLDVNHQVETLELARDLIDDGRTIVAAIHDLDLAARYCDRLLLVADGAICADGDPDTVLTADMLDQTFDANATVTRNPVTGTTSVTAFPHQTTPDGESLESALDGRRVHVLGTGQPAVGACSRLERAGVTVSAGPAPAGGVVEDVAERLSLVCVTTEPFSPVTDDAREETGGLIESADVTVLAGFDLSAGNQRLLEVIDPADPLVAVETGIDRSFAGPEATARYRQVLDSALEATPETLLEATAEVLRAGGQVTKDSSEELDGDGETSTEELVDDGEPSTHDHGGEPDQRDATWSPIDSRTDD
ncbi:heme ABC transporter ATP-binding protein [Natrialbaceae archaeon A-CW1-1]